MPRIRKCDQNFRVEKVGPGEDPRKAVKRELLDALAVHVTVVLVVAGVYCQYPAREVLLVAFECVWSVGELRALAVADYRWVSVDGCQNMKCSRRTSNWYVSHGRRSADECIPGVSS